MLIWDTGEYEILKKVSKKYRDPDSDSGGDPDGTSPRIGFVTPDTQSSKLASAFSRRKIRLRLHGTRLPPGYTLYLRLTKENDRSSQPKPPAFKRRRKVAEQSPSVQVRRNSTVSSNSSSSSHPPSTSDVDTDISIAARTSTHRRLRRTVSSLKRTASPPRRSKPQQPSKLELMASEPLDPSNYSLGGPSYAPGDEEATTANTAPGDDVDEAIRRNNAYPGASNTVGSIHQRKWYLSLDRELCGFKQISTPSHINHHAKTYWVTPSQQKESKEQPPSGANESPGNDAAQGAQGFQKFHVLGREHERSVVTGRLAADILEDEGVQRYVPRGLWTPVLE